MKKRGPCPVFASFTLAFALQLRKKQGKPSVRVRDDVEKYRRIRRATYGNTAHVLGMLDN
jgi:hypothetical protein